MKYLGPPQSGSVANQTASRNRYGQYFRDRIIPTDPSTPGQISSRALFALAASNWAGLTDAERLAWSEWAARVPSHGKLGTSAPLTGQTGFIGAFMVATEHGLSAPAGVPPEDPSWSLIDAGLVLSSSSVVCSWVAAPGARVGLYLTGPTPATRAFNSAKRPKLIATSTAAGSEDVFTNYDSFFGGVPSSGQTAYLVVREVSGLRLSPGIVVRAVAP